MLWRKLRVGRNEILKIPLILKILILTKALAIWDWFRLAVLAGLWIPAFAGMTRG